MNRKSFKKMGFVLSLCAMMLLTMINGVIFASGEEELAISGATASTYDTRCVCDAPSAIDGDLNTRWSGDGDGSWLKVDLGAAQTVAYTKIAWYHGDTRSETFDIYLSTDDSAYTLAYSGVTDGSTAALQTFDFTDQSARYVKIVGHGNTTNTWNSISEIEAWGTTTTTPPPDPDPNPISITNPGFEDSFTGWTRSGTTAISTSDYHSGTHSAKLQSTGAQVSQTISGLTADTSYTLKAWILGNGIIGANSFGDSEVTAGGNTSSWTQFTVTFTTGSSNTSAVIFARGTTSSDVRFDDFTLEGGSGGTTPPTTALPSDVLDLSAWKITLPIPKTQGSTSPLEIFQPALDSYSIDPWFKAVHDADGDAVQFRANHGAVSTSGSSNPRSELREMVDNYTTTDSSSNASWGTNDGHTHTLYIKQKVTHLTSVKPHTVVGQIHDADDDVTVFRVEGHNPGGVSTTANLYITDGNSTHAYLLDNNYVLGTVFTVKFIVSGGVISYEYNGQTVPYTQTKNTSGCYFKLGNYTQSNDNTAPGESPDAYAENWVYEYTLTHQ